MTTPSPQNPGAANWALLMLLGVIWGGAFMSVRMALDGFGPWSVAAGRTGLGALALLALGPVIGQSVFALTEFRQWFFASIIGVLAIATPFAMLSWGQQYVPSAFAGVAMGAVPLLVLPLVWLFSPEEGIGPRRIMGMVLGFIGLLILIGPAAASATDDPRAALGRFACLGAGACYAIGSVITRRAPPMPPVAFATASLIAAAVMLVPVALILEGVPDAIPLRPGLGLLYAALLPTALAAILRVQIITTAGSLFMSLVSYMVPIWSVILGVVFLGENLPPQLFIALGVILAGIALSQSRAFMALLR